MKELLAVLLLMVPIQVFSQNLDRVILNQGQQVDGIITEQEDSFIKIEVSKGNERIIYKSDIKEILTNTVPALPTQEELRDKKRSEKKVLRQENRAESFSQYTFNKPKGLFINAAINANYIVSSKYGSGGFVTDVKAIVGYRFSPFFVLGSGIMLNVWSSDLTVYEEERILTSNKFAPALPIYFRSDFCPRQKVSPFVSALFWGDLEHTSIYSNSNNYTSWGIGWGIGLDCGIGFNVGKKYRMDIGVNYAYYDTRSYAHTIGLIVGFNF